MTERYKTRKHLKIAIISSVLLLLIGYTSYEIQRLFSGPQIHISYPDNGSLISNSLITITGSTENIKDISFNDRKIFIDEKGNFNEKMLLSYGYNVIVIRANDKFGRETEKQLEIIHK
jgi:hypothetical protein